MNDRPDQFDPQLEAYLDGLLHDAERAAFEARLTHEPALRQAAEQQRRIDATLRASMQIDAERLTRSVDRRPRPKRAVAATSGVVVFWIKRIAAAAVIALLLTWGLLSWQERQAAVSYSPQPPRDMVTVYRDSIATGFSPQWRCETEEEFAYTFSYRLGQPLTLASASNVESLGLAYGNVISPSTIYMLARVDGAEVVVFVDRADRDTGRTVDPATGLNLFRRQLGSLVLYELTPLNRPHILPLFESPPLSTESPTLGPSGFPGLVPSCPSSMVRAPA